VGDRREHSHKLVRREACPDEDEGGAGAFDKRSASCGIPKANGDFLLKAIPWLSDL
jgi:hypothetical protein